MDKTLTGIILMSLSTIAYGIGNPILKKAGYNPFATIFIQISFLWLTILPFFILTKSYVNVFANKQGFLLLIFMGVINAIGYYLIVKSFAYLPI